MNISFIIRFFDYKFEHVLKNANSMTLQQCNRDIINTLNISDGVLCIKVRIDV